MKKTKQYHFFNSFFIVGILLLIVLLNYGCLSQNKNSSDISNKDTLPTISSDEKISAPEKTEPISDNGSKTNCTEIYANGTVTVNAHIKGGSLPYTYRFSHKADSEKWSDTTEQSDSEFSVKVPSYPCTYTIKMTVNDKAGYTMTKMFNIIVKKDTKSTLKAKNINISADYVCSGTNTLFVSSEFEGGVPPYKYKYSYINSNGTETELKDSTYSKSEYLKFSTSPGNYTIRVTAEDCIGTSAHIDKTLHSVTCLPLKNIYQYSEPELPTGCEVTSLATCLNYYNFNITKNTLADQYLPIGYFEFINNEKYGPDPENEFAGNPNIKESYGCYSNCIATAANNYFKDINSPFKASALNGKELEELYMYLNQGKPVIIWTTMYLAESYVNDTWKTYDGNNVEWLANEHCVVLAGYDKEKNTVYIADPLNENEQLTECNEALFKKRYNEINKHAVIIGKP